MRTWRLDLDADAHAPRLARHSVRAWLDLVACSDETKADITIVVSDFVSDAVTSAATHVTILLVFDDGRLRVDVHADRHEALIDLDHQAGATPCQSLADRITEAATDSWGRTRTPDETHSWAEILC